MVSSFSFVTVVVSFMEIVNLLTMSKLFANLKVLQLNILPTGYRFPKHTKQFKLLKVSKKKTNSRNRKKITIVKELKHKDARRKLPTSTAINDRKIIIINE